MVTVQVRVSPPTEPVLLHWSTVLPTTAVARIGASPAGSTSGALEESVSSSSGLGADSATGAASTAGAGSADSTGTGSTGTGSAGTGSAGGADSAGSTTGAGATGAVGSAGTSTTAG